VATSTDDTTELYQWFPKLAKGNHELTSPYDSNYNCVAFALGLPTWRNPQPGHFRDTIRWIEKEFGYRRVRSAKPERGYEKLAIYADNVDVFKHIAKQKGSKWESKLGELQDLTHHTLDLLVGTQYGNVVAFLRRKRQRTPRT
jgi:hypothetical protein